jgi:hypothetical protein
MPAELFTKLVSDVITRVKTQFGDTSGAQINDQVIIRWINDGQQEIVNSNAILKAVKIGDVIANQAEYTFPTDRVQYIEALYVEGRPIKNLSPQGARDFILATDPTLLARGDYPELWYERGGIINLYPVPQKTFINGLKMEYVKMPTQVVNVTDVLSIPDRYINQLVNYCMVQALEYDENYSAAQLKLGQFRDGLDRLHYKENISQSDLYPVVSPDPADYV